MTRRARVLIGGAALCCMAVVAAGCGGKTDPRKEQPALEPPARADTVVVEGLLTGETMKCAAVRSAAGDVFALEDVPPPFDEWQQFVDERFMVVGEEVGRGRCGQTRTLRVLEMGLVLPPALHPDPNHANG